MPRHAAIIILALCACLFAGGCDGPLDLTPSAHERYTEGIRNSGMEAFLAGEQWLAAAHRALLDPAPIELPYQEQFWQSAGEVRAEAWKFPVAAGEQISIQLDYGPEADGRWFVDLFEAGDTRLDPILSLEPSAGRLDWEAAADTTLLLRAQPELLATGSIRISIGLTPALTRPLDAGISSAFGAPRDGGRRDHHGVDLFAPRGTPILAADTGRIIRIGNTGLGGLHIWQSSKGRRLYYAHLDEVLVQTGQRVEAGQVIARVGNSGNARTTSPHLHFGVYQRLSGPVDPAPLIRRVPALDPDPSWMERPERDAVIQVTAANLRGGPGTRFPVVEQLKHAQPVQIEGLLEDWYRISTPDGIQGFVATRLVH